MASLNVPGSDSGVSFTETDTRPNVSPYAGDHVNLYFSGYDSLLIPLALLSKSPKLSSMVKDDVLSQKIAFPKTSLGAGHVMVHYLYTGTYQCLKPKGDTASEIEAAEFKTAVEVYHVARKCQLPPLVVLAQDEIERLGAALSYFKIFDLVKRACESIDADDAWLIDYLGRGLKPALQDPDQLLASETLQPKSSAFSMSEILLRGFLEIESQRLAQTKSCEIPDQYAGVAPAEHDPASLNGDVTPQPSAHDEVPASEPPEDIEPAMQVTPEETPSGPPVRSRRNHIWWNEEVPVPDDIPEPPTAEDYDMPAQEPAPAPEPVAPEWPEETPAEAEPEPILAPLSKKSKKKKGKIQSI